MAYYPKTFYVLKEFLVLLHP